MYNHPFRKSLGLIVLYSAIIIGIFILQFKNESSIFRSIGPLKMTLAEKLEEDGSKSLKNSLSVTFKGLEFEADDVTPAILTINDSQSEQKLSLLSWKQENPLSFTFEFTDDVSLTFASSGTSSDSSLSVTARLPETASKLTLSYKPSAGYSVTEQSPTRQVVSSKNLSYAMTAPMIQEDTITFTKSSTVANYAHFNPAKVFTFYAIPDSLSEPTKSMFDSAIKSFRDNVLQAAEAAVKDSTQITENAAVLYVEESAARGNYTNAVAAVPASFKNSNRRTYLSAPYFNTLAKMNSSLTMANENTASMIKNAIAQKNPDVFTSTGIEDYFIRNSSNSDVRALLSMPATIEDFKPTLAQASAILWIYTKLSRTSPELADHLSTSIQICLTAIEKCCTMNTDNTTILLTEDDAPVSFEQTIFTGAALYAYGNQTGSISYTTAGQLLIIQALNQNSTHDIRTLADIYPILVPDNNFAPRSIIAGKRADNRTVWAWTCANSIDYAESNGQATISIKFKQGDTNYIILKNIKPFSKIEIYGLDFHSDPRFEYYNSSGYTYIEESQTLLLKTRHKSAIENIRLTFSRPAAQNPAPTNPVPADSANTATE